MIELKPSVPLQRRERKCSHSGTRTWRGVGWGVCSCVILTRPLSYAHADFVTFPSLYEGFGNALVEAMYFRMPTLVNRYSVYVSDIAPLGCVLGVWTRNMCVCCVNVSANAFRVVCL
jgi:hypothetical protein